MDIINKFNFMSVCCIYIYTVASLIIGIHFYVDYSYTRINLYKC